MSFQADYHIHHHVDPCADAEMTLSNIEEAVHEMGLQEITVLTHCSTQLPGDAADWGWWHKLREDRFALYLSEVRSFSSKYGTRIYSGIETELVDDKGNIATTEDILHKVDMAALSLHYLPDIAVFPWLPDDFPPSGHGAEFQNQVPGMAACNQRYPSRVHTGGSGKGPHQSNSKKSENSDSCPFG